MLGSFSEPIGLGNELAAEALASAELTALTIPLESSAAAVTASATPRGPLDPSAPRPRVHGKFIFVGDETLVIRGVTYGPFASRSDIDTAQTTDTVAPCEYHTPAIVRADFSNMAAAGINTVRVYTVPPKWLLDIAAEHGLRVIVGIPWEQHVTFLDTRHVAAAIVQRVRHAVRSCGHHHAVLAFFVGNEIPAAIVRWYGPRIIERFIERLYRAAKREDPDCLVSFANYPTTEYLNLPFLDFVAFNVYLESAETLQAYVARLQNVCGDRPLLMSELGLDAKRHGEQEQAIALTWQIDSCFEGGCAGTVVFSWTDEWSRGGTTISEWGFGLTDQNRQPKPALRAVQQIYARSPIAHRSWPSVSVIVCSYNGSRTLRQCLDGLKKLDYPGLHEIILVNDGSTDATPEIAAKYSAVRLITTNNQGLSAARNTGLLAARGDIVAYIDDDAWPDPHWLTYLADTFIRTDHVGVGGPNMSPHVSGGVADCVAHAPGGPIHVLLNDTHAEHLPGCNMAFRRERLLEAGGFDPQFRIAGDDVDICWRLIDAGGTLGFNPAAAVWHCRRDSVKAFWRQQVSYGRAEADLERKWPQKYNAIGHLSWAGRMYCRAFSPSHWLLHNRIYHGTWGSASFQTGQRSPKLLSMLPLMPEWYLLIFALAVLALLGFVGPGLHWAFPALVIAVLATLIAVAGNVPAQWLSGSSARGRSSTLTRARLWGLTFALHLMQPVARLWGRLTAGLTPWRRKSSAGTWPFSLPRVYTQWSENWRSGDDRLASIEASLHEAGAIVSRGGSYDAWDLEVRGGLFGRVRLNLVAEEHGAGRQLVRVRVPRVLGSVATLAMLALAAATLTTLRANEKLAAALLATSNVLLLITVSLECTAAASVVDQVLQDSETLAVTPSRASSSIRRRSRTTPRHIPDVSPLKRTEPVDASSDDLPSACEKVVAATP